MRMIESPLNYIRKRNTKILEADKILLSKLLKNEKLKVLKYAREALNFLESLDLKADDFTQKEFTSILKILVRDHSLQNILNN